MTKMRGGEGLCAMDGGWRGWGDQKADWGWNHNAADPLDKTHPMAVNPYVRPRLKSTMPICPMKMPKWRGPAFAQEDWAGCPPLGWASELAGERGAAEEDAAAAAAAKLSSDMVDPQTNGGGSTASWSTSPPSSEVAALDEISRREMAISPPSSEVRGVSRAACTSASEMVIEWRLRCGSVRELRLPSSSKATGSTSPPSVVRREGLSRAAWTSQMVIERRWRCSSAIE